MNKKNVNPHLIKEKISEETFAFPIKQNTHSIKGGESKMETTINTNVKQNLHWKSQKINLEILRLIRNFPKGINYGHILTFSFLRFCLSLIILSVSISNGFGQEEKTTPRGFQNNSIYSISDIESINNTNGNIMFNIPIASLPAGRGGMSVGLTLNYNSKLWDNISPPGFVLPPGYNYDTYLNAKVLKPSPDGGWRLNLGYSLTQKKRPYVTTQAPCDGPGDPNYRFIDLYKFVMTFPDGSSKEFKPMPYQVSGMESIGLDGYYAVDLNGTHYRYKEVYTPIDGIFVKCELEEIPYTGGMTFYTEDGSNLRLEVAYNSNPNVGNFWTLIMPDGTRVTQNEPLSGGGTAEQRIYDRNENFVEITGIGTNLTEAADQLGRKISIDNTSQSPDTIITAKGFGDESLVWRLKWKSVAVSRQYQISDDTVTFPNPGTANSTFSMIEEIILPTQIGGQSYKFQYNGKDTGISGDTLGMGEVSEIELPSGAKANYEYKLDGLAATIFHWKDTLHNPVKLKKLTYNSQYDGASTSIEERWVYDITRTSSTITSPNGGISNSWYSDIYDGGDGVVTKSESADGTVNFKKYLTFGSATIHHNKAWERLVEAECTVIRDGSNNLSQATIRKYSYDHNGNLLRTSEYDWVTYSTGVCTDSSINVPSGILPKRIIENTYYNSTPELTVSPSLVYANEYRQNGAPRLSRLLQSTEIKDSSNNVVSRSEFTYDNASTTGNLTEVKTWDSTKGAYSNPLTGGNSISVTNQYDTYGNLTQTTDAKGIVSKLTYGSITTPTGTVSDLYPTQSVTAFGTAQARTTNIEYDFTSGAVKQTTDVDNGVSTATEYDDLARPTKVKAAVGTANEIWTQTVYDDVNRRVIVKSDLEVKGDAKKVAIQHFDQLGRVRLARTLEDASTEDATDEADGIKVQTRYKYDNPTNPASSNGTYSITSNPYRASTSAGASSEEGMGWTLSYADKTGKTSTVKTYGGATLPAPFGANSNLTGTVTTEIDENTTTVTDQAGKLRRSITNALGQLIRVDEPNDAGQLGTVSSPNQATSYLYDTLNNLTTVTQGGQTRTFSYNSLSRLTQAVNPESGTISYSYDNNGNLTSKTDARSVVTSYAYDNLNRVTQRSYSDSTPTVTYTYDDSGVAYSKGKLTKVSSSVSESKITGFDVQDRVIGSQQIIEGQTYNFSYQYNLGGDLTSQTLPSGRVVTNTYDNGGDLAEVSGTFSSQNKIYADNFSYTAHEQVNAVKLGNNRWETTKFNSNLQITEVGLGTSSSDTSLWKVNYLYGTWESEVLNQQKNNNSLAQQTIVVPSNSQGVGFTATQAYLYDSLDRLKSAQETTSNGLAWKQTFIYDRFGNRNYDASNTTLQSVDSNVPKVTNPEILTTNNRYKQDQDNDAQDDYLYDASGNLTKDAQNRTFTYDGENRQKTAVGDNLSVTYSYDGNDKRVKSFNAITNQTTVYVYDADGDLAAEYLLTESPSQTPTTSYLTMDALGSPRVITDQDGEVKARRDFLPFGEDLYAEIGDRTTAQKYSANDDTIRQKFTGYQRDEETKLDYAQSRYYSALQGRFTSPDEFKGGPDELFDFEEDAADNPTFYADLENPQSLNKYQYTYNNPYRYIDPSGHCPMCIAPTYPSVFKPFIEVIPKISISVPKVPTGTIDVVILPSQMPRGSTLRDDGVVIDSGGRAIGRVPIPNSSPSFARGEASAGLRGNLRVGQKQNIGIRHPTRKAAKEAAQHPKPGKIPNQPPKWAKDKNGNKIKNPKRTEWEKQQKYKKPERHPNSNHPKSHFHDRNKPEPGKGVNRHHYYPKRF